MDEEVIKNLNNSVDKLNELIEKQTSFKFVILKGLVYGVSVIVGTSILAGVLLSFLNNTPIIDTVFGDIDIQQP